MVRSLGLQVRRFSVHLQAAVDERLAGQVFLLQFVHVRLKLQLTPAVEINQPACAGLDRRGAIEGDLILRIENQMPDFSFLIIFAVKPGNRLPTPNLNERLLHQHFAAHQDILGIPHDPNRDLIGIENDRSGITGNVPVPPDQIRSSLGWCLPGRRIWSSGSGSRQPRR
jgi:hypothetical protein